MTRLLCSPFFHTFEEFIRSIETTCLICSPYITWGPIERLVSSIQSRGLEASVHVRVLTDISAVNLLNGSTDLSALRLLCGNIPNTSLTYLPRIHAKVYVSGEEHAIVGSANFTDGGCFSNLEYGVRLQEPATVRQIIDDITHYSELGGVVTQSRLATLEERVNSLRAALIDEQDAIRRTTRTLADEIRRDTEDELLRSRVEGRSVTGVFAQTILYLLNRGPMSTIALNDRIQEVHPDLCDDSLDRVIDGEHFGKLWKHQVRTAQQHLKRRGSVVYSAEQRLWRRT
jgi:hypothetical protein